MVLTLFGKTDCGLCEEAGEMLAGRGLRAIEVDVEADEELMARYGLRIPVLCDEHGRELDWPFDAAQLGAWLDGACGQ